MRKLEKSEVFNFQVHFSMQLKLLREKVFLLSKSGIDKIPFNGNCDLNCSCWFSSDPSYDLLRWLKIGTPLKIPFDLGAFLSTLELRFLSWKDIFFFLITRLG